MGLVLDDLPLRRAPHPGVAALLSALVPGLGQVYCGRLLAGGIWFVLTSLAYRSLLAPGLLAHAVCVALAWQDASEWRHADGRGPQAPRRL